jgi:hypothetical protein
MNDELKGKVKAMQKLITDNRVRIVMLTQVSIPSCVIKGMLKQVQHDK